jgi:hypothetical protein
LLEHVDAVNSAGLDALRVAIYPTVLSDRMEQPPPPEAICLIFEMPKAALYAISKRET